MVRSRDSRTKGARAVLSPCCPSTVRQGADGSLLFLTLVRLLNKSKLDLYAQKVGEPNLRTAKTRGVRYSISANIRSAQLTTTGGFEAGAPSLRRPGGDPSELQLLVRRARLALKVLAQVVLERNVRGQQQRSYLQLAHDPGVSRMGPLP